MNMTELAVADLHPDATSHPAHTGSPAASAEVFQQLGAITRQLPPTR